MFLDVTNCNFKIETLKLKLANYLIFIVFMTIYDYLFDSQSTINNQYHPLIGQWLYLSPRSGLCAIILNILSETTVHEYPIQKARGFIRQGTRGQ